MGENKPASGFQAYIVQARVARGWGVREAARAIGLAHSRLLDFEQGFDQHTRRPCKPSLETMFKIATAYQVPVADLLERAGYKVPDLASTDDEREVLNRFRRLDSGARRKAIEYLKVVGSEAPEQAEGSKK